MKTKVTKSDFLNCELLTTNYSYEGLEALFAYLEQYEHDTGEEIEFDPIAIITDYTEYTSLERCVEIYCDEEELPFITDHLDWLQDRTQVIEGYDTETNKVIIQDF